MTLLSNHANIQAEIALQLVQRAGSVVAGIEVAAAVALAVKPAMYIAQPHSKDYITNDV